MIKQDISDTLPSHVYPVDRANYAAARSSYQCTSSAPWHSSTHLPARTTERSRTSERREPRERREGTLTLCSSMQIFSHLERRPRVSTWSWRLRRFCSQSKNFFRAMKAAKRSESDELALDSSTWADRAGAGAILDSDPFLVTILGDRVGTKELQGTGSEDTRRRVDRWFVRRRGIVLNGWKRVHGIRYTSLPSYRVRILTGLDLDSGYPT